MDNAYGSLYYGHIQIYIYILFTVYIFFYILLYCLRSTYSFIYYYIYYIQTEIGPPVGGREREYVLQKCNYWWIANPSHISITELYILFASVPCARNGSLFLLYKILSFFMRIWLGAEPDCVLFWFVLDVRWGLRSIFENYSVVSLGSLPLWPLWG